MDLGANDYDAKTCNLDANCYGTELRVQKIKRNLQESKCEYLSKNG